MNESTHKLRCLYADHISAAVRYAMKNTLKSWPEDTFLVVKSSSELAQFDDLIGWKILIMDMPSSYDYFVAFPSEEVAARPLQKAFLEYIEMNELEGEQS